MNKKNKLALAACSGMSPYGLISRITSADIVEETDNTISYVWELHPLIEQDLKV